MLATITPNLPVEYVDENGEIIYPDSDGKRMSDNTLQLEWIIALKNNLDLLFAHRADVFVAGDLWWYPVQGNPLIRVAPDALVALGRPKGHRGSYKQWQEGNMAPQVVFEILSPGNTAQEMNRKWHFYQNYGVEEYYLYDPNDNHLQVWIRQHNQLMPQVIFPDWTSPLLGIRFVLQADTLKIYFPDGQAFLSYVEQVQAKERERKAKEEERKAKEEERKAKEEERKAKEEERKAKEIALQQLAYEQKARVEAQEEETLALAEKEVEINRLKDLLKQLGINQ
ncbi:MAG: Uma2 family endonuclease [Microscillaceae bacterium]|jgi:Uma2 family endonuclease|nr:Uma2 family endonuclease [Microscillaceae bacterium]